MNHWMIIQNLGPVKYCECEIKSFTIITGAQSSGKSTIAKSIYFFRSIKQDIISIMQLGGPQKASGTKKADWITIIQQRLRNKFLELFGTSWIMPDDMRLEYHYSDAVSITVYLQGGYEPERNYIRINFSQALYDYLKDLDERNFLNFTLGQMQTEDRRLSKLFDDEYESVFIPAGRSLITLLSTQLNYIFTSLEGTQLRNIDYISKRYVELILKLKPLFSGGIDSLMEDAKELSPQLRKIGNNKSAINQLFSMANEILKGKYRYVEGEERLYLEPKKFIKINFASSGQQEIIWVINLLFYYLYEGKRVFLIIEEPESHLFPESQQSVGEMLSLFSKQSNQVLVTTHSPYILGTFNYLLLADQAGVQFESDVKKLIHKRLWLPVDKTIAFFLHDGTILPALDSTDGITLVKNELIDGASTSINQKSDALITLLYQQEESDEHQ